MTEDVYATPDLTKKVRFQAGEKEDRKTDANDDINDVTIYDNYCSEETTPPKSEDKNPTEDKQQTSSVSVRPGKSPLKAAAVFVGLLCLVLLAAVIVLMVLLIQNKNNWNMERNRLTLQTSNLEKEKDLLNATNNNLTSERDELQTNNTEMKRFNNILTLKTHQLESDINRLNATNNNLTSERDEMESINHDLKIKTSELEKEINRLNATNKNLTEQIEKTHCPDEWIKFDSSCYSISNEKKSWTESEAACEEHNAQLVIISSIMEQIFIHSLDLDQSVWIGLNDIEEEGRWKWVNGTDLQESGKYWRPPQPDNYHGDHDREGGEGEDCVEFSDYYSFSKTWNDVPCSVLLHFICEKRLP